MTSLRGAAPRKVSRLGLYGPFIALAIASAAWSGGWLWLKSAAERRLDAVAARLAGAGGALTWTSRSVHGFPFRLDLDFKDIAWREPSGWAIGTPTLKSEALAFNPTHWVAVAPDGAVLTRPTGGAVKITGTVLRASLSDFAAHPMSFSLEGIGLRFASAPSAESYFLDSAGEVHIHTRAGPADRGAFYVELDRAQPRGDSALGRMAAGKPVTLIADVIYSRAGALAGSSWPDAVGAWARAGGAMNVRRLRLQAGPAVLDAHGDNLSVDQDGRLAGVLTANLTHAPQALAVLSASGVVEPDAARTATAAVGAQGAGVASTLTFQAGRMTLGPVALAPSPKVY